MTRNATLLQARIRQVGSDYISDASKKMYMSKIADFIVFLYKYANQTIEINVPDVPEEYIDEEQDDEDSDYVDCILPSFAAYIDSFPLDLSDAQRKKRIIQKISSVNPTAVFDFNLLSVSHFLKFIHSLTVADGSIPSYSTYNTCRAAFNHLYRMYEKQKPSQLEATFVLHYKAIKRNEQRRAQNGEIEKGGKSALPFAVYRYLAKQYLQIGNPEFVFAHSFMTLCWNAMTRCSNTEDIALANIKWSGDAMQLRIHRMKNDQEGERNIDPKHIFANPLHPEICPILALAIYLSCFEVNGTKLFPGPKQGDRFRTVQMRLCQLDVVKNGLALFGLKPEDLGVHSLRKGSATYCSSGSTACPSQATIDIRGGWSQGKIKDVYQHYQQSGDQFLGRTVSGLPRLDPNFAILPPFFKDNGSEDFIRFAVESCFPNIPVNMFELAKFCLASIVYHSEFLRSTLPNNHILFTKPIFTVPQLVTRLKPLVLCRIPTTDDMPATGIPPDIVGLLGLERNYQAIREVPAAVGQILEERTVLANQVTPNFVRDLLNEHHQQIRLMYGNGGTENPAPEQDENREGLSITHANLFSHFWGGKIHHVPINFNVPTKVDLRTIWQIWCLGIPEVEISPLRHVENASVKNPKRLSDLRYLMKKMKTGIEEAGRQIPRRMNITNVNELLVIGRASLNLTERRGTTNRRMGQISWITIVRELRLRDKEGNDVGQQSDEEVDRESPQND